MKRGIWYFENLVLCSEAVESTFTTVLLVWKSDNYAMELLIVFHAYMQLVVCLYYS